MKKTQQILRNSLVAVMVVVQVLLYPAISVYADTLPQASEESVVTQQEETSTESPAASSEITETASSVGEEPLAEPDTSSSTTANPAGEPSVSSQTQGPAAATGPTEPTGVTGPTGPTSPNGDSASTYSYNTQTGLWENEHFIWDPVNHLTRPKSSPSYAYNYLTGTWETSEWRYDAPTGRFVEN